MSDETLEYLLLYNWPGNVRQLANELRRMIAMADAERDLDADDAVPRNQGVTAHDAGVAGR